MSESRKIKRLERLLNNLYKLVTPINCDLCLQKPKSLDDLENILETDNCIQCETDREEHHDAL